VKLTAMKYLLLSFFLSGSLITYSQITEEQVKQTIVEKDSLFWIAYNKCDVEGMTSVLSDDVEFYHDMGGVTMGRDSMMMTTKKNLCGNDNFRLRRAPVKGTVKVYVMKNNKVPYGAIISGQHVFYVNEKGNKEYLDGLARFSQLWILKDGVWKMTRILSYDHGPAPKDIMDEK